LFSEAVEVKSGRETLLKDVQMKDGRRGWIRHLVVNESGEPLDGLGTWEVRPPGWIGAGYPLAEKRVVNQYHETQPDSPGTYDIIATWSRPGGLLAAMTRVEFRGADMAGKMIVRKPEGKLTGSVVLQDAEGKKSPVAGAEVAIGPKISYFARSGAGGELPFPAMYQGRYQLGYVRGIPADSFVMSVKQGGRDVLRDEVVVGKESAAVEVVVSAGAGVVAGKVTDASGGVVHNALVALVPMGALRERKDYYGAFRDTRTDQKGMFEIRGVAPGEYQAYAWSDAPASAFRNEEFVKGFAGTKVIVGSGASVKLELRALP
jgi:hypothetical protein